MNSFVPLLALLVISIILASSSPFNQCDDNICYCDAQNVYRSCPAGCDDCYDLSSSLICTGCIANYWLNPATHQCDMVNICGIGGYYNESVNQCFLCPQGCHLCLCDQTCQSDDQLTCSQCLDSYFLNETSERCQKSICDSGFYLNPYDYTCYSCPTKCDGCFYDGVSDSVKCQSCLSGFFYNSNTSMCAIIEICDPGFYYDETVNKCFGCPKYCTECSLDQNHQ